jgi:hypothetical protein
MSVEFRLYPDRLGKVPQTGAVESVQEAELDEPASRVVSRSFLEWAAHAYWRLITRFTLGLIRITSDGGDQCVVLLGRPLVLLRFHAPVYEVSGREGSVSWRIKRGLLVSSAGRDRGTLRLSASAMERSEGGCGVHVRKPSPPPPSPVIKRLLRVAVQNFCPWLRGSGRSRGSASGSTRRPSSASTGRLPPGFLRRLARTAPDA